MKNHYQTAGRTWGMWLFREHKIPLNLPRIKSRLLRDGDKVAHTGQALCERERPPRLLRPRAELGLTPSDCGRNGLAMTTSGVYSSDNRTSRILFQRSRHG